MNNSIKYAIDYKDGNLSESEMLKFEDELAKDKDLRFDFNLLNSVDKAMRAKLDIEDVNEDINLKDIDNESKKVVAEYNNESAKHSDIKAFISEALMTDEEKEIAQIESEINEKGVDKITADWVQDWNNSQTGFASIKHKEVTQFVQQSFIKGTETKPADLKISWYKTTLTRTISISAAATLALFFVVRSFIAPSSPQNLFETNYKPYQAFTSVTRSDDENTVNYNQAIVNYRQGNYELAAIEFELLMKSDTFNVAPYFFAGLSQIELGNYSKAIELLDEVVKKNRDFSTEAQWYLGLTYLKTGDTLKSISYFTDLKENSNYYKSQAATLLKKLD